MKLQMAAALFAMTVLLSACSGSLEDRQRIEQLERDLVKAERENTRLTEELEALQKALDGAPPGRAEEKQAVLDDLLGHPELIPGYDPASPWVMRYYPDLSAAVGCDLVYAYAEDGHQSAELLLRYGGGPGEGGYQWTLEAYSPDGARWRTAWEQEGE